MEAQSGDNTDTYCVVAEQRTGMGRSDGYGINGVLQPVSSSDQTSSFSADLVTGDLACEACLVNYMIWNPRGTGARSFPALVRDLKAHYQLDFIAILEMRCKKDLSIGRAKQLGFPYMELMDGEGYSGGIWCLWEHSIGSVSLIERHSQFVHFQVTSIAGLTWTFMVVYASPSCVNCRSLWDNLARLAPTIQGP
ncbi:hypothetical protein K1719_015345 [Acacia pycnantha]|nr:hypothetical protein K1719_015345 [Acacia pycnantha]